MGGLLRQLRLLFRLGRYLATAGVLAFAAGYLLILALHLQPLVIVTGSMQKTIPVGSLVVDQSVSPSVLKVGDVISFRKPIGASEIASHRIIKIQRSNGHTVYRTKGDSNPVADPWALEFEKGMRAHKVLFHLPWLGYILLFARSKLGILLFVSYTCLVLIGTVLKMIATGAQLKAQREAETDTDSSSEPERLEEAA